MVTAGQSHLRWNHMLCRSGDGRLLRLLDLDLGLLGQRGAAGGQGGLGAGDAGRLLGGLAGLHAGDDAVEAGVRDVELVVELGLDVVDARHVTGDLPGLVDGVAGAVLGLGRGARLPEPPRLGEHLLVLGLELAERLVEIRQGLRLVGQVTLVLLDLLPEAVGFELELQRGVVVARVVVAEHQVGVGLVVDDGGLHRGDVTAVAVGGAGGLVDAEADVGHGRLEVADGLVVALGRVDLLVEQLVQVGLDDELGLVEQGLSHDGYLFRFVLRGWCVEGTAVLLVLGTTGTASEGDASAV